MLKKKSINFKIKKVLIKSLPYFSIFIFALILTDGIIFKHAFWGGLDSYFHMNAFYEDAEQIKSGHFSYFLSLFAFNQSGRIVNALYGPIFSYLGGALLLICGNWVRFEALLFPVTLTVGGIGTYLVARKINISKIISLLVAFLYLMSHPIITGWLTNSEYTGLGALLLPFALIAGINIIQQHRIRIIPLAILMTIYLQIHLVTSLIAVLILIPAFIISFISSHHKIKLIQQGSLSLGLTILLSGNIIGALYEIFSSNHLIPTAPSLNLQTMAGAKAVGFHGFLISVLGPIYTFLFISIIPCTIIIFIIQHRSNIIESFLLIECFLFFWLSSVYFPWNRLGRLIPNVFSIIQFPQRFISIGILASLLIIGKALSLILNKSNSIFFNGSIYLLAGLLFLITLMPTINSLNQLNLAWNRPAVIRYYGGATKYYSHNPHQIRNDFKSSHLSKSINVIKKISPDYMPTPQKIILKDYHRLPIYQTFKQNFIYYNPIHFHKRINPHARFSLSWHAPKSHHLTKIPLVAYRHTTVRFNHKIIHPQRTIIGTLLLKSKPGNNQITIQYHSSTIFKIFSVLTILSWTIIIIMIMKNIIIKGSERRE